MKISDNTDYVDTDAIQKGIADSCPRKYYFWVRDAGAGERLMREIASRFRCHQFDPSVEFGTEDLFFWCGDDKDGRRDYSYYTLSYREDIAPGARLEMHGRMLALLNAFDDPAGDIEVEAQWTAIENLEAVAGKAHEVFRKCVAKGGCIYDGERGALHLNQGLFAASSSEARKVYPYVFVINRRRGKGWLLTDSQVVHGVEPLQPPEETREAPPQRPIEDLPLFQGVSA